MAEFPHGTPDGYDQGCKTAPGCPALIPCKTVWVRYRSDWSFRRRFDAGESLEQIVAADLEAATADVLVEREARRVERTRTHEPREKRPVREPKPRRRVQHGTLGGYRHLACRTGCPESPSCAEVYAVANRERYAAKMLRVDPGWVPRERRRVPAKTGEQGSGGGIVRPEVSDVSNPTFPHGTTEGYEAGCFTTACPATPTCAEVNLAAHGIIRLPAREPREPREKAPAEHGSLTMYLRGCRGDDCPAAPSCREFATAWYTAHNRATVRVVKPHGTNASYARGCRKAEDCPNFGTDLPTCKDAQRAYHVAYMAAKRAVPIPVERHGSAYGYQLGCTAGAECPAVPSCAEVVRAADEARNRRRGIQPAPSLVDAGPVREHVRELMAAKVGLLTIAERAGVGKTLLANLLYGRMDPARKGEPQSRIARERAVRIMAVKP